MGTVDIAVEAGDVGVADVVVAVDIAVVFDVAVDAEGGRTMALADPGRS